VLGNRLILAGVLLEITVLVLFNYSPWANVILGTAPLAASVWLVILPFAVFMLILEEARKWLARRRQAGSVSRCGAGDSG